MKAKRAGAWPTPLAINSVVNLEMSASVESRDPFPQLEPSRLVSSSEPA